jgi:hypothetical protein
MNSSDKLIIEQEEQRKKEADAKLAEYVFQLEIFFFQVEYKY